MSNWKLLFASAMFLSACDVPQDDAESVEIADQESDDAAAKDAKKNLLPQGFELAQPIDPSELINVAGDCYLDSGGWIVCIGGGDGGGGYPGGGEQGDNCGECVPNTNLAKYPDGGRQYCIGLGYISCIP